MPGEKLFTTRSTTLATSLEHLSRNKLIAEIRAIDKTNVIFRKSFRVNNCFFIPRSLHGCGKVFTDWENILTERPQT